MSVVTVIMPAYNAQRFIAEAIQSVQAQTLSDWRLCVVDDGSSDQTRAIAESFAHQDRRIRVISGPNAGIAHAMNRAIEHEQDELVACMHADDVMLPQRLERQLEFAGAHSDVAVFSSFVEWIDERGRHVGVNRSELTTRQRVSDLLSSGGCVAFPHPAVLFRRSVIRSVGGYRQDFFPAEDTELWNRVALAGHGVLVQPEVLLKYRIHGSSASMSRARLMIRKLRWMEVCLAARRTGSPEPTWEQFLRQRQALPLFSRIGESRRDFSRTLYQLAIGHYASRRFPAFATCLTGSALFEPELVLPRLLARLSPTGSR